MNFSLVFSCKILVFSGVFRRFPVIRCFPVFLVTEVGAMLSGTYGPWYLQGRQIGLYLVSQRLLGKHFFYFVFLHSSPFIKFWHQIYFSLYCIAYYISIIVCLPLSSNFSSFLRYHQKSTRWIIVKVTDQRNDVNVVDVKLKPLSLCDDISGDMRWYKASYNSAYIAADSHELLLKFSVKFLYGWVPHDMSTIVFGEIVTDYYDLVRVSSTLQVRVLRHPYEVPSILFEITTCLY